MVNHARVHGTTKQAISWKKVQHLQYLNLNAQRIGGGTFKRLILDRMGIIQVPNFVSKNIEVYADINDEGVQELQSVFSSVDNRHHNAWVTEEWTDFHGLSARGSEGEEMVEKIISIYSFFHISNMVALKTWTFECKLIDPNIVYLFENI